MAPAFLGSNCSDRQSTAILREPTPRKPPKSMIAALTWPRAINDNVDDAPHVVAGRTQRFDAENALKLLPVDDSGRNARLFSLCFFVIHRRRRGACLRLRRRRRLSVLPGNQARAVSRCETGRGAEHREGDHEGRLRRNTTPPPKETSRRGAAHRHGLASFFHPAVMANSLRRR